MGQKTEIVRVVTVDPETRDAVTTEYAKMGAVSDGYHTFDELYRIRMLYNAAFFNAIRDKLNVVKSHKHSDGEEPFGGGWFIVVAQLPTGQISNHYENKYWNLFQINEVPRAPEWDGHTAAEAADRLQSFLQSKQPGKKA